MENAPNESELVSRAVGGDPGAVQELLLLHYDSLSHRLAGSMPADLQGTLTVEDVLQEAFADAVQAISSFESRGEGAFFGWLATIAEHRLIDLVRAARAMKRGGGRVAIEAGPGEGSTIGDLVAMLAADDHTPSRSMAGHEAVSAIQAALRGLRSDYREVLQFRYFDGLSVAQTAERMNRTEPAVHMLCHRAVAQLRESLGDPSRFLSR
ncbi:MAG: sigma-70 family RNA polymerase sigma factor [Phycisphaerales bacterium]|nr:sigma-70 family RNA polymerase sigma factor [Phycisphaerales bacterium]